MSHKAEVCHILHILIALERVLTVLSSPGHGHWTVKRSAEPEPHIPSFGDRMKVFSGPLEQPWSPRSGVSVSTQEIFTPPHYFGLPSEAVETAPGLPALIRAAGFHSRTRPSRCKVVQYS